jgi:hypothetical protein
MERDSRSLCQWESTIASRSLNSTAMALTLRSIERCSGPPSMSTWYVLSPIVVI